MFCVAVALGRIAFSAAATAASSVAVAWVANKDFGELELRTSKFQI